ncbi:MAG TPA: hypothetical protein VMB79_04840 [Jatrophihabitans sp.]|nr:hypothetical protein [Jatrophihabitans sp.]
MNPLLLKAGIGVVTLAAGGSAALFGSAAPAVAYSSPPVFLDISIGSPAHLVAKGAAVQVPVTTSCTTPDHSAYVSVSITERVGKKTASGSYNFTVSCVGSRQTNLVTIASGNGLAFAKGRAYAAGTIQSYYYYPAEETTSGTIAIKS